MESASHRTATASRFIRGANFVTMNPDGTGEKVLVSDGQVFDYEWSPDGKSICYARMDGSFASELYIPATGATAKEPASNVSRFATYNGGITWSKTGNNIAFVSQRRKGTPGTFVLSLQKPSVAGIEAKHGIDWEDIHLRAKQAGDDADQRSAPSPATGAGVAFRSASTTVPMTFGSPAADGSSVTRSPREPSADADPVVARLFPIQIYFRDGSGNLRTILDRAAERRPDLVNSRPR